MSIVQTLSVDDDVNVYVCGDIHGSYDLLMEKLNHLNFDFNHDLLIAVGDIIDRGSQNIECLALIQETWFKSILGNHEDFCIKGHTDDFIEFYHKLRNNGGAWFYEESNEIRETIVHLLKKLPVMLEVEYHNKLFGFIHADVPVEDWDLLRELLINDDNISGRSVKDLCLWNRGVVYNQNVDITGVHNVFLGHTVLDEIKQVGNCTFLDTGGCFKSYHSKYDLSIVRLSNYI